MKILLGTRNDGKIAEIRGIFRDYQLLSYREIYFNQVKEDGKSYTDNAVKKALTLSTETNLPVLAEDSGLEVSALDNKPGVYSSRFAGENASDAENMAKLLDLLSNSDSRKAKFSCVAAFYDPKFGLILAKGRLKGKIAKEKAGQEGFGYDPVFIPAGFNKTLAQLGPEIKNKISHRKMALTGLKTRLKAYI